RRTPRRISTRRSGFTWRGAGGCASCSRSSGASARACRCSRSFWCCTISSGASAAGAEARCNLPAPSHIPVSDTFSEVFMPRWPAVLLITATGLAAQQPSEAPRDSSHVARVLALLETSDSTVCELAGQAISNAWGFSWEPRLLPSPMPMPMPTPMPMPMAMHRSGRAPHVRVPVHRGAHWYGEAVGLGAFRAVLRHDNRCVRQTAAWALGEIASTQAIAPLGQALHDRSPQVRTMAAWALGQIESPRAVPVLGDALKDPSPDVRRAAVWALGQIEDRDAVDLLLPLLRDHDAQVRLAATHALGQIESPRAVHGLGALAHDESPDVRRAAIWALG